MIVATGAQGEAIRKLSQMVAASSAFQERVKTYGQGELDAGKFVHCPYLDDPNQAKRPFALIEQGTLEWYTSSGGRSTSMLPKGSLKLSLADNMRLPESDVESEVDFRNFVDGLLADLADMSGSDDLLNINAMRQTQEPVRTDPRDVANNNLAAVPFWWCQYEIEWGAV